MLQHFIESFPDKILNAKDKEKIEKLLVVSPCAKIKSFILEKHLIEDKTDFSARYTNLLDIPNIPSYSFPFSERYKQATVNKIWAEYDLSSNTNIPHIFFDTTNIANPYFFFNNLLAFYNATSSFAVVKDILDNNGEIISFSPMFSRAAPEFKLIVSMKISDFTEALCSHSPGLNFSLLPLFNQNKGLQINFSINLFNLNVIGVEFIEPYCDVFGLGEPFVKILKNIQELELCKMNTELVSTIESWIGKNGMFYNRICHIKINLLRGKLENVKAYLSTSYKSTH